MVSPEVHSEKRRYTFSGGNLLGHVKQEVNPGPVGPVGKLDCHLAADGHTTQGLRVFRFHLKSGFDRFGDVWDFAIDLGLEQP